MKQHIASRVTALLLAMIMMMGMLPASALTELSPEVPPVTTTQAPEETPPETETPEETQPETETPEETPTETPAPEDEAPADLLAAPKAGEVPYLPVVGAEDFVSKPTFGVRFLYGGGESKEEPFTMTNRDYIASVPDRYQSCTIEITLMADGGQNGREVTITLPNSSYIGDISYSDLTAAGGTVEKKDNKIVYKLNDGPNTNLKATVKFSVLSNIGGLNGFYPKAEYPFAFQYSATDSAGTHIVSVVPESAKITYKDVPSDELVNALNTVDENTKLYRSQAVAGTGSVGFYPFLSDSSYKFIVPSSLAADAPPIFGIRMKVTPSNSKFAISSFTTSGRVSGSGRQYGGVVEENGSYILTSANFSWEDATKASAQAIELYVKAENTDYGETCSFTVDEFTVLGQGQSEGKVNRAYQQTVVRDWKINVTMRLAPQPVDVKIARVPHDGAEDKPEEFYFSAGEEQKLVEGASDLTLSFLQNTEKEDALWTNAYVTIALPDGLAGNTKLRAQRRGSNKAPAEYQCSYDEGGTWSAPETLSTEGTDYYTPYITLRPNKDGKMPTHVRYAAPKTRDAAWYNRWQWGDASGGTYRNGGKIQDGDEREYTVTFTADDEKTVSFTDKIIYKEYIPAAKTNQISFSEASSLTSKLLTGLDYDRNGGGYEPEKPEDKINKYCSDKQTATYTGKIAVYNGYSDTTFEHTNAILRLSSQKYAQLVTLDNYYKPFDLNTVFEKVVITLSDDTIVERTQAQLPYTAPAPLYIRSADYVFSKIATVDKINSNAIQNGSFKIEYKYQLPPSGHSTAAADPVKDYLKVEFVSSTEVPAGDDAASHPSLVIRRDLFRGMSVAEQPLPVHYKEQDFKYSATAVTVGQRLVVSGGSVRFGFEPGKYIENKFDQRAYRNADYEKKIHVPLTIGYKINQNFRYVSRSASALKDTGSQETVDVTANWRQGYFPDGDGLLCITSDKPTAFMSPSFAVVGNIDASTGRYILVPEVWYGGDYSTWEDADGVIKPADDLPGCSIKYVYSPTNIRVPIYSNPTINMTTEVATGVDLNGDGKTVDNSSAIAIRSLTVENQSVDLNVVKQEGISVYGTSAEDNVESIKTAQYYGAETDSYTYRTFILAQVDTAIKDMVVYIPIPRAGIAPNNGPTKNQWDAKLTKAGGKVFADKNNTYQISYSTLEKPTMLGLSGSASETGYQDYNPANPPDLSKITMLRIKTPLLPKDTADDIELTFTCMGQKPAGALTNHMESHFLYITKSSTTETPVAGPTRSILYTLTANSVAGTVYTDANYDGKMNTFATNGDSPAENVTVTLYHASGAATGVTATTDSNGKFVMEAPAPGKYSIGVAAKPSETRKLMYAKGVTMNVETGRSELFNVDRTGVHDIELGYRDKRSFTLYSDTAHKVEIKPDTVVDVLKDGDTVVRYTLSPAYFVDATKLFTHTVSHEGMFSISSGAASSNASTLHGLQVTGAGDTVTLTVSLDDGIGGTDTHSFQVRVLPPRVVAEFGRSLNYYTDVLYYKNSLLGDVTFKNRTEGETDEFLKNFKPIKMVLVKPGVADEDKSDFLKAESHTFAEDDIGKYEITFEGKDSRGRPIVDINGNETVVRTIYMHGYPDLTEKAPLHTRVLVDFNPKVEANGTDWLTATHEHVAEDGTVAPGEVFSAEDNNVSLSHYKAYKTDGTKDFKQSNGKDIEYSSLPAEPGMYEVYYSVHLGHDTTSQIVHRTLYKHGSPVMRVPGVITIPPDKKGEAGKPIDLDYAATAVWTDQSLVMEPLVHVNENGSLATYGTATSLFYLKNGDRLPLPANPDPSTGNYVIVSVKGEGDYKLPDPSTETRKSNVFLDKDSSEAIMNAPGIYPVVIIFQDTIDGMGAAGTEEWNKNKKYAYDKATGVGYKEMSVNVVITDGDTPPILPSQDQLVVNFVMGDSNRFEHLTAFDNTTLADIKAMGTTEAQALVAGYDDGSVRQYDYTHKNHDGEMEAHGIIRYFKAISNDGDVTKGDTDLLTMVETAIQMKSHDIDVHALLDTVGAPNGLTQAQYDELHSKAIELLWKNLKLTELRYVDTAGKTVIRVNPTDQDLITATQNPGTYELTVTAADIKVQAVTETGEDTGADFYQNNGWRISVQKDKPVHATYKCYVSSDLKFRLADHTKPLVTFGLHLPDANSHSSMEAEAFYTDGKTGKERIVVIPRNTLNISAPNTAVEMNYMASHPISKQVSATGSAFASLRKTELLYKGIAFVNSPVRLTNNGGPLPIDEVKHYVLTGETTDLTNNKAVRAEIDKFTNIIAPTLPEDYGKSYPSGTWSTAQPIDVQYYELVGGVRVPIKDPTKISSIYPGTKTILLTAEDVSTVGGAYHNGPNRAEKTATFVFDSPISLTFGPKVKTVDGQKTLTVLSTAGQGDIKEALAAIAVVTYGENPGEPTSLIIGSKFVKDADGKYSSVTMTASDKRGRTTSETINLVLQDPAIIHTAVQDASGALLNGVTQPIDITGAVIGGSYMVFAPMVEGYALASGQPNARTINPVQPGVNDVAFRYVPVKPSEKMVEYTVDYTYEDAPVQRNTQVGIAGKEVSHTTAAEFVNGAHKYTLKTAEPKSKTITLDEDKTQNVLSFAYDRAAVDNGGGGGGGGTVNYYSVLYTAAPYGTLDGIASLQVKSGGKPDSAPKVIPQEGYTFLGWHTGDKSKLVDPLTVKITQATVFYAAFKTPGGETVGPEDSASRPIPELELNDHLVYLLGDELGNFRPDAGITRAEVVVLFSRLLKEPMPKDVALTSKFADVSADKWYASTVAYMEQFGIITGYEDGTFRPEAPIARSEFVAIASRFSQLELTDQQLFPDVPSDNWAAVHINSAKLKGWITGYEDGTFRPTQTIARAEAVKIVNALLGRGPDTAYIDAHAAELAVFPDLAVSHWAYYEIMEAANAHDHSGKPERWTKVK